MDGAVKSNQWNQLECQNKFRRFLVAKPCVDAPGTAAFDTILLGVGHENFGKLRCIEGVRSIATPKVENHQWLTAVTQRRLKAQSVAALVATRIFDGLYQTKGTNQSSGATVPKAGSGTTPNVATSEKFRPIKWSLTDLSPGIGPKCAKVWELLKQGETIGKHPTGTKHPITPGG